MQELITSRREAKALLTAQAGAAMNDPKVRILLSLPYMKSLDRPFGALVGDRRPLLGALSPADDGAQ